MSKIVLVWAAGKGCSRSPWHNYFQGKSDTSCSIVEILLGNTNFFGDLNVLDIIS